MEDAVGLAVAFDAAFPGEGTLNLCAAAADDEIVMQDGGPA